MNPEYPQNMRGSSPENNSGDNMKVMKVCPVCQTAYYPWQAQVLEERHEAHLVYVECHKCGSGQVALIISSAVGTSTVGLITDLTPTDVVKFKDSESVSADDVLDIHQELEYGSVSQLSESL